MTKMQYGAWLLFVFFVCCWCNVSASAIQDTQKREAVEDSVMSFWQQHMLKGQRLYPLVTDSLAASEAKQDSIYLLFQRDDTLLIVTDAEKLFYYPYSYGQDVNILKQVFQKDFDTYIWADPESCPPYVFWAENASDSLMYFRGDDLYFLQKAAIADSCISIGDWAVGRNVYSILHQPIFRDIQVENFRYLVIYKPSSVHHLWYTQYHSTKTIRTEYFALLIETKDSKVKKIFVSTCGLNSLFDMPDFQY